MDGRGRGYADDETFTLCARRELASFLDLDHIASSIFSMRVNFSSMEPTRASRTPKRFSIPHSFPSMPSKRCSMLVKRASSPSRRCSTLSGP